MSNFEMTSVLYEGTEKPARSSSVIKRKGDWFD